MLSIHWGCVCMCVYIHVQILNLLLKKTDQTWFVHEAVWMAGIQKYHLLPLSSCILTSSWPIRIEVLVVVFSELFCQGMCDVATTQFSPAYAMMYISAMPLPKPPFGNNFSSASKLFIIYCPHWVWGFCHNPLYIFMDQKKIRSLLTRQYNIVWEWK